MNTLDWNDLRYVLAVDREGSAAAAAKRLGVSHATVLRRIQATEQSVGTPLFERLSTGYLSTDAGRMVVTLGESLESAIMETQRLIDGRAAEFSGALRFTTTDSLAETLLPRILSSFRDRYPKIIVQMVVSNALLSLDRRDADVTLRPSVHPPESLVGTRLARMDFAVYAAPFYLEARPQTEWQHLEWLLPDGPLAISQAGLWVQSEIKPEQIAMTVDSFVSARSLAEAGMGVTVLPIFLGETSSSLRRIGVTPREASSDLWLLTHANLRRSGRIRAFMDHVSDGVRNSRHLLQADGA